jgi:hypothetical protein
MKVLKYGYRYLGERPLGLSEGGEARVGEGPVHLQRLNAVKGPALAVLHRYQDI